MISSIQYQCKAAFQFYLEKWCMYVPIFVTVGHHDVMVFIQQLESTFDLKIRIKKKKLVMLCRSWIIMTWQLLFIVFFPLKLEMETIHKRVYIRLAVSQHTIITISSSSPQINHFSLSSSSNQTTSPPPHHHQSRSYHHF